MLAFIKVILTFIKENDQNGTKSMNKAPTLSPFKSNSILDKVTPVNINCYKLLMVKMKLSYMVWKQKTDMFCMFSNAIIKTLKHKEEFLLNRQEEINE